MAVFRVGAHIHAAIIIDYDGVKVVEVNMFHPIKTENDEG